VEIHQATGVLMDILDLPAGEALARLRARAFASNVGVAELARSIVAEDIDVKAEFRGT
jgi:AmiR/NasT family two-component response regulator